MNSIRRFVDQTGSALALVALLVPATFASASAAPSTQYEYQHTPFTFTHIALRDNSTMVGTQDPGFRALLNALGTFLTWKPGSRYVLLTTAQPEIISFSVGNVNYDVGSISAQARVAPYFDAQEVYLPLRPVLAALDLAPKRDGSVIILQPQIAALDVKVEGSGAVLEAHAGTPLHPRIVASSPNRVVYQFDGVGSTLPRTRNVDAGGIRSVTIETSGTLRAPKTRLTINLANGAQFGAPRSNNGNDFSLAVSGSSPESAPIEPAEPAVAAMPAASAIPAATTQSGPAQVTSVTAQPTTDGTTVTVAVTGDATYEWHRLRAPDNRFWVDLADSQLVGPPLAQTEPNPLVDLRVRQINPTTVRVALSLVGQNDLSVSPSPTGLSIVVGNQEIADASHEGSGSVGTIVSVAEAQPLVTPAPPGEANPNAAPWKFGPQNTYVPTNPKLIVIDPGHGGSDRGAVRNGTAEATLALDMAHRLRDILLARGWQVVLTHTADVDVYAPNDSAHDELQARDDIANNDGARLLISIHCNSYINDGPSGTTTYYAKPSDLPLAQIIDQNLANDGTKDDGIVKSHLYIPLHALMPSVLIETAFLSNPSDYALLTSSDWRQKIVEDMANGIDQYAQAHPVEGGAAQ